MVIQKLKKRLWTREEIPQRQGRVVQSSVSHEIPEMVSVKMNSKHPVQLRLSVRLKENTMTEKYTSVCPYGRRHLGFDDVTCTVHFIFSVQKFTRLCPQPKNVNLRYWLWCHITMHGMYIYIHTEVTNLSHKLKYSDRCGLFCPVSNCS